MCAIGKSRLFCPKMCIKNWHHRIKKKDIFPKISEFLLCLKLSIICNTIFSCPQNKQEKYAQMKFYWINIKLWVTIFKVNDRLIFYKKYCIVLWKTLRIYLNLIIPFDSSKWLWNYLYLLEMSMLNISGREL